MVSDIAKIEKSLAGSWRLPPGADYDACVTLLPNKTMEWIVTPTSASHTVVNIVRGEKMTGTWAIRKHRPHSMVDGMRRQLRGSSGSMPDSSLDLIPAALKNFANYNPETGKIEEPAKKAIGNTVRYRPTRWWLVLKITNFPESLLRLPCIPFAAYLGFAAGIPFPVNVVDWAHALKEIFADHAYALRAYSSTGKKIRLRPPSATGAQPVTWERVSWFFGTEEKIDQQLLYDDDQS